MTCFNVIKIGQTGISSDKVKAGVILGQVLSFVTSGTQTHTEVTASD